jgi:hypothetical protein
VAETGTAFSGNVADGNGGGVVAYGAFAGQQITLRENRAA